MRSKFSIAVLPFANFSSDEQNEYFSDGVSEEILNALSKIDGLHVIARTSSFRFKNKNVDIRDIGNELNVSLVLEGSVRKSGDIIRVTAQLIETENGFHLWSDSWDRELRNIFKIQDEIASIIVEKIMADIPASVPTSDYIPKSADALDLYLKGKHYLKTPEIEHANTAVEFFERSIAADPEFVKSYIGLCDCYTWLSATGHMNPEEADEKVARYIGKALALDPNLPDGYSKTAGKNFWIDWDIPMALKNINKALDLVPSSSKDYMLKGMILASLGRIDESLGCLFQSERLDPFSDSINYCLGYVFGLTNDNQKSLGYIDKNISIAPFLAPQYMVQVETLCKLSRFEEAWETIQRLSETPSHGLYITELKAYYFASKGDRAEALDQIRIMEDDFKKDIRLSVPYCYYLSIINLMLGEIGKAIDHLDYALRNKSTPFLFIKIDHHWDGFQDHPGYVEAVKHLNFQVYERAEREFTKKYEKSILNLDQAKSIKQELGDFMKSTRPYLDPKLSLSDLAESINVGTQLLSQVLNEYIGSSFYDYVNAFRLTHFLDIFNKPEFHHFTMLALAYESGFNSKSTFNAFFKKTKGVTPSEYFRKQ